ncbi:hypothetical protein QQ045_009677 [Rhodiola kirilowii]
MDSRARKLTLATIRDMLLSPMHPTNLASFKDMLNLAVRMGFVHRGLTPAEINPRLRWKMFDFLELTLITPGLGQDFWIVVSEKRFRKRELLVRKARERRRGRERARGEERRIFV